MKLFSVAAPLGLQAVADMASSGHLGLSIFGMICVVAIVAMSSKGKT